MVWLSGERLTACVVVDDFGMGYSSLARLLHLPLDGIKIDRSFLLEISEGGRKAALVEAIISLARSFELTVVAEGGETREQLRRCQCDEVQGYLLSHPVPGSEFVEQLRQGAWSVAAGFGD